MRVRQSMAAAMIVFYLAPSAHAARIVSIHIIVDGKPYLDAMAGDNGEPGPAIVWRYLTTRPLKPAAGVTIVADPGDPLKATIKGKILVEVRYGGKAEVTELHLDRPAANVEWTVAHDDVEAMAKAIGLGEIPLPAIPPPKLPLQPAQWPPQSTAPRWLWPVGALILVALFVAVRILGRNSGED